MNQALRDNHARKIGEIIDQSTRQIISDDHGRKIGEGNLLTALLRK